MRLHQSSRKLLIRLALVSSLSCISAAAGVIIEEPPVGPGSTQLLFDSWAIAWHQTTTWDNVTISAVVGSSGEFTPSVIEDTYLFSALFEPNTTVVKGEVGDIAIGTTALKPVFGTANSFPPGPLRLGPGTYYLVLTPIDTPVFWKQSSTSGLALAPGVSYLGSYLAILSPDRNTLMGTSRGADLAFRITGDEVGGSTQTPEPASITLMAASALLAVAAARRSGSRYFSSARP